tara:strand:+ start:940 stop:1293 length:354 start_codon:yes stop_codon:yes gene_type:complete
MRGSVNARRRGGKQARSKATGEKIWRLTYDVGCTGKRRKQKRKDFTGTRAEAEKELRQLLNQADKSKIVVTDLTVAQFLKKWWQWKDGRITPKVHARYDQIIDHNIIPVLGKPNSKP